MFGGSLNDTIVPPPPAQLGNTIIASILVDDNVEDKIPDLKNHIASDGLKREQPPLKIIESSSDSEDSSSEEEKSD